MSILNSSDSEKQDSPISGNPQQPTPGVPTRLWQQGIFKPMQHVLAAEGKRLRSDLVEIVYRAAGGRGSAPIDLIDFVELMHNGSLVIDDIEDGSNERRGQQTLHEVVGTPLAINMGNWMYFSALEKLLDLPVSEKQMLESYSETIATIRRAHEGQALDLTANVVEMQGEEILPTVRMISKLKTGGITALAAKLGAVVAGGDEGCQSAFYAFGMRLGTGLQMQNDIAELKDAVDFDILTDDLRNCRVTWPWAWASRVLKENELKDIQGLLKGGRTIKPHMVASKLMNAIELTSREAVADELSMALVNIEQTKGEAPKELKRFIERIKNYNV
ncbi:MAG: polyprenyl synthetase family protein [Mariniblastus sp.]|nr:polyprenyl synthetase family protein [Mariniblastus sp.]